MKDWEPGNITKEENPKYVDWDDVIVYCHSELILPTAFPKYASKAGEIPYVVERLM